MPNIITNDHNKIMNFHILQLDDNFNITSNYSDRNLQYCSYGTYKGNNLYFVSEVKNSDFGDGGRLIISNQINNYYNILSNTNSFGLNQCYIDVNDNFAFISNYSSRLLLIVDISNPNKPKPYKIIDLGKDALVHCSITNGNNLYIICKGKNSILTVNDFLNNNNIEEVSLTGMISPKHIIKGNNNLIYVITENNSKLITFKYTDTLELGNVTKLTEKKLKNVDVQ